MKAQLNACEKEVVAAKQSLDQCKTDAANEVQKEQERCQKRVDALRAHLAQTEAEMQAQVSQEHGQNDCPKRMRWGVAWHNDQCQTRTYTKDMLTSTGL